MNIPPARKPVTWRTVLFSGTLFASPHNEEPSIVKPILGLTARALLSFAVLLCQLSCSGESDERVDTPSAELVSQSLQVDGDSKPGVTGAPSPDLPAPGEIVILSLDDGTVTVLANQASATRLLRRLSKSFEFELLLGEFEDRRVQVFAVNTTLGDVHGQALEGIPYALRYGVKNERSQTRVAGTGRENPERRGRAAA